MIAQSDPQRPTFHRVRFPLAAQPHWIVGDDELRSGRYLSESSCRLGWRGDDTIDLEQSLCGMLRFADGDQIWIEGKTIRQDSDGVVAQFTKGVTLETMVALQHWLRRKYPARHDQATADHSR